MPGANAAALALALAARQPPQALLPTHLPQAQQHGDAGVSKVDDRNGKHEDVSLGEGRRSRKKGSQKKEARSRHAPEQQPEEQQQRRRRLEGLELWPPHLDDCQRAPEGF